MSKSPVGNNATASGVVGIGPDDGRADGGAAGAIDTGSAAPASAPPEKRRRGRPSNAERADNGDASASASASGAGKTKAAKAHVDIDVLSSVLVGIHTGLANLTEHEHWKLDKAEADVIAGATANVLRHFPMFGVSERRKDIGYLVIALATAYGPRVTMSVAMKKRKPKNDPMAVTVPV